MNHPAFWTILILAVVFAGVLLFIRSSQKRDAREAQARNEARERFEIARRQERAEQDRLRLAHARKAAERRASPLATSAQGRAVPSAEPRRRTDHSSDLLDPLNPLNPLSPLSPVHQAVLADPTPSRSYESDSSCSTKSAPSYSGYGSASESYSGSSYGGSSSYSSDSSSGSSDSGSSSSCD